jgi:DNA polymerase-3 subunit gamma/tau
VQTIENPSQNKSTPKPTAKEHVKPKRVTNLASLGLKSKTGALSINELTTAKDQVNDKEVEFSSAQREIFTEEQLMSTWKKLAEKIKEGMEEGSSIVYAAMSTHTPRFNEKFQIQLKVDNLSQEEEVRVFRTEIHSYLRKELKNGAIELLTKIIKDKKEKKAYTPEEKFNKLAENNPNLLRLKRELDLDFF